jgi:isoaspartyl peptidase/L-asparaginase-like protein (Ntn-hydrolase superfamily)
MKPQDRCGLVAVDAKGRVVAPYNTLGMARGWITADGVMHRGNARRHASLAMTS